VRLRRGRRSRLSLRSPRGVADSAAMGPREERLAYALMMIGGVVITVAAIIVLILGLLNLGHLFD
jgi:hypothetical protein